MGATLKLAVQKGVARGLFSNEAGMGSTPHAHAVAKVNHPVEQGFVAMIGVFIDTFVILNLTALVIITTGSRTTGLTGAQLLYMVSSVRSLSRSVCYSSHSQRSSDGISSVKQTSVTCLGQKLLKFTQSLCVSA